MINFKHVLFLFFAIMFIFSGISFAQEEASGDKSKAEGKAGLEIPISFTYSSLYWWRGEVINDGAGLLWPGVGASFGDTGIELSLAAGVSQYCITKEDHDSIDSAKAYTEIDYGIAYSKEIQKLSIGAGITYIQYPLFDKADPEAIDSSFLEGNISLGVDTVLSPVVELFYDYYIKDRKGTDGKDVPTAEDYYAKFSVSHDIISTEDGFTLSAGAWIGYYNNPYYEASGWSDTGLSLGFSKDYNNLNVTSTFYYGRTLGKDFQEANKDAGAEIKDHFWCDFGLTYTL